MTDFSRMALQMLAELPEAKREQLTEWSEAIARAHSRTLVTVDDVRAAGWCQGAEFLPEAGEYDERRQHDSNV